MFFSTGKYFFYKALPVTKAKSAWRYAKNHWKTPKSNFPTLYFFWLRPCSIEWQPMQNWLKAQALR